MYKRYEKMKDSGVEWIGEIPRGWKNVRFKHYYSFEKGNNAQQYTSEYIQKHPGNYPVYSGQTENNGVMGEIDSFAYDINDERILITTVGARAMTHSLIQGRFSLSQNIALATKRGIEFVTRYVFYFLFPLFERERSSIALIMQPSLRFEDLNKYYILQPSLPEQKAIATFLDRETSRIDKLIEKKERHIELLKEKRQALITQAVTRGLDPAVKMKDSCVEWLGKMPAHWKLRRARYLFQIKKRIAGELGFDVLSITQKGIVIKDIESNDGQLSMDYSKYQIVEIGDFAMNHMDLLTGFVDISAFRGVTSPDYRVFSIKNNELTLPQYYLYIFQMCYLLKIFYAFGQGVSLFGRWRLPAEEFKNFLFPIPPLQEQISIARFISNETTRIDAIVDRISLQIIKLRELRQSLISDAVTGKIDVRSYVSPEEIAGKDSRNVEVTA